MRFRLPVLAMLALSLAGCSKHDSGHPWVEPGMSREQVRSLIGSPSRVDSIYHQYDFDPGAMTAESLASLRYSLDKSLADKMTLGIPVDRSYRSDQYTSWYYGPVITDTMFSLEQSGVPGAAPVKVWYEDRKQRTVIFDNKTGTVKERGFRVLEVRKLPQPPA